MTAAARLAPCPWGCPAAVYWLRSELDNEAAAVDPEPSSTGTVTVDVADRTFLPIADEVLPALQKAGFARLHALHRATCPNQADQADDNSPDPIGAPA